jgi:hypothetical protein
MVGQTCIPALRRLRRSSTSQSSTVFEASLGYTASPHLKRLKNNLPEIVLE